MLNHYGTTSRNGNLKRTSTAPKNSQICPADNQKNTHARPKRNGNDKSRPLTITSFSLWKKIVKDRNTNVLYPPLSSRIVLKRKMNILFMLLDFENGLIKDSVVDSRAYVSAIIENETDRIRQQTPTIFSKINDLPIFKIRMAGGLLERLLGTDKLETDIGGQSFADHFVILKNLTRPKIQLHSTAHKGVVFDTTHSPNSFVHFTMQVKRSNSKKVRKPNFSKVMRTWQFPPDNKTTEAFTDHASEWITSYWDKAIESESLLFCHSISP